MGQVDVPQLALRKAALTQVISSLIDGGLDLPPELITVVLTRGLA